MKNSFLFVLLFVSAVSQARDIRTPLSLYWGYQHYPVSRNCEVENCFNLMIEAWGAGYSRTATQAFGAQTKSCADDTELTQLLFGKSHFTLSESFAHATVGTAIAQNPFVSIATIAPRFDYKEQGAFFGFNITKRFCCHCCDETNGWRTGVRLRIPYRDIDMRQTNSCAPTETIDDVYFTRQESNDFSGISQTNTVFAARLDFLSALKRNSFTTSGNGDSLVKYNDPDKGNEMTIGTQKVSGGLSSTQMPTNTAPFVAAIDSARGIVPSNQRWGAQPSDGSTVINGNGLGISDLGRGRFVSDINYAPLGTNQLAQSKLWIVPNVDPTTGLLIPGASIVATEIANAVTGGALATSVTDFIASSGLDFCQNGRNRGLGDIDLEWYVGYDWCNLWAELQLGLRLPTGKQLNNVLQLIRQPLGNNGHLEIRPGIAWGWDRWEKVKFNADLTYSFVLTKVERLPAAFVGATVINIGPEASGKVSWGYFWGDVNVTFIHPHNDWMGISIGYEAYVKKQDSICFCNKQAVDFAGNLQDLDARLLEKNSDRVAQKLRTEIFCASCYCHLFAGFLYTVSGRNVTRDADMYIGLTVNF